MSLTWKLAIVLLAFVTILVIVIWMAFRERKLSQGMAANDAAAEAASDGRVMAVIFTAIIGGMLLTLIVAYLVFT